MIERGVHCKCRFFRNLCKFRKKSYRGTKPKSSVSLTSIRNTKKRETILR